MNSCVDTFDASLYVLYVCVHSILNFVSSVPDTEHNGQKSMLFPLNFGVTFFCAGINLTYVGENLKKSLSQSSRKEFAL